MSNSPLVTYTRITKNKTSPRNHAIDTITIHCIVGQWTAKQGCDYFATTDRQYSANYVVGKDGSIGLSVNEKDRSWCSSSRAPQGARGLKRSRILIAVSLHKKEVSANRQRLPFIFLFY